jgi:hypothetical protein
MAETVTVMLTSTDKTDNVVVKFVRAVIGDEKVFSQEPPAIDIVISLGIM